MPKLYGFRVMKFVAADWHPAEGHELMDLDLWARGKGQPLAGLIEHAADLLDDVAQTYARMADQCALFGHRPEPMATDDLRIPACALDEHALERSCVVRARKAIEITRSADRPQFVVVDIPVS